MPGADTTAVVETLRARAAELPDWLRAHTGRVVAEGRRLAQLHETDPLRVQAAAWGHDLYRHLDDEALLCAARDLAIAPDAAERAEPILLHGPLAAARAQRAWGVGDAEVLDAIRVHTTGRPGMGPVALTLFLADKLEPAKIAADGPDAPLLAELFAAASTRRDGGRRRRATLASTSAARPA